MSANEFQHLMTETLKDVNVGNEGHLCGYCDSEEEIANLLTKLKCVGYSYSVRRSVHYQKSSDEDRSYSRFFFMLRKGKVKIPFFGSPFSVENTSYRECILGPKYRQNKEMVVPDHLADHVFMKRKRNYTVDTRRNGCPATFSVKCVRIYPGYSVQSEDDRSEIKKQVIDKLREDLLSPDTPSSFLRFYVVASPPGHHKHLIESVKAIGDLHPLLANEITNVVKNGITSAKAIRLHLETFVNTNFTGEPRPDHTNIMFYPTQKTIYNHVYNTLLKIRKYGFGTNSSCSAQTGHVEHCEQDTSTSDEINEEQNLLETPSTCSSLHQRAREICNNIIDLTSNCDNETLKRLINDLEKVQRSVELSNPV